MPTIAAPYGGRVVKLAGNRVNTGGNSLYPIVSNYGTSIFFGQPVVFASSGVQVPAFADLNTGSAASGTYGLYLGIFMGCTYTDPNLKYTVFRQFYPASTVASDIQAYVMDDPNAIIQIQASAASFNVYSNLGTNYALNAASGGSTTTGNCNLSLDTGTAAATATNPFKVVGIAQNVDNINASGFVDVLVQARSGLHIFNRA
jgi:hypothetical protein